VSTRTTPKPALPSAAVSAVAPIVHPIPASVIPELIRWRMEAERRYIARSLQRNLPKGKGSK
jgi:hypothetical protein